MEEKMHATVPLQMMFGWLAGWLLLQSAVVASSRRRRPSIVVLCGASCGAPTVGIVQTALCAMLRGGNSATAFLFIITTTRWEGTHQSIHPSIYIYIYIYIYECGDDDDAYFDRPSLTAALAGKKSHRHRHHHHPPTHPPTHHRGACVCVCVCVCVYGVCVWCALSLSSHEACLKGSQCTPSPQLIGWVCCAGNKNQGYKVHTHCLLSIYLYIYIIDSLSLCVCVVCVHMCYSTHNTCMQTETPPTFSSSPSSNWMHE